MKKILSILFSGLLLFCIGCAKNKELDLQLDDVTIYYSVSFVQEGEEPKTITVEKGKKIEERQIPQITAERIGYAAAWEKEAFSAVKSDLTINVVYTPNEYKIFYYLEKGGEIYDTQDVTFDEAFSLLKAPTASGKNFIRWACVNAGDSIPEETWTKDGDLELYAIWELWSPFG